MKTVRNPLVLLLIATMSATQALAKGAGTSGGLTLIEPFGARPASLGEAFSAVGNDIAAFGYNPASLDSLETGQASFMYQKGMAEDSYGHFMMGAPMKKGSFGLSVGYYNGGDMELFDGTTERTVNAQTDMTVALGYAGSLGKNSIGITGKYLSSELIETAKATAFAMDLGVQRPLTSRLSLGAAVQNIGTKMTYLSEGDDLPRIARVGASVMMFSKVTLLLDAPYHMNEAELRPAVGVEGMVGPLAMRAGYKSGNGLEEFSFGTGFMLGRSNLDYSFGMVDQLDSRHRVSLSMKYGGSTANGPIVRKPVEMKTVKTPRHSEQTAMKETKQMPAEKMTLGDLGKKTFTAPRRQVYTVKAGDTLGKIAKKSYGDAREWKKIYSANRHLLNEAKTLEVGQKIVLP